MNWLSSISSWAGYYTGTDQQQAPQEAEIRVERASSCINASEMPIEELNGYVEKLFDEFSKDVRNAKDERWEKCASGPLYAVWRSKQSDDTGIYQLKVVGRIPFAPDVVSSVLFNHDLRMLWDINFTDIRDIDTLVNGSKIVYYAMTSPFPQIVGNRDFLHLRNTKVLDKNQGVIVLDVSTVHTHVPEKEYFIRAETKISGGLLEPTLVPNVQTKLLDQGTLYSCITQVDMKGIIPKSFTNMVASQVTSNWFDSLSKACESHSKGELKKAS